ncbi:MAG: zinc ribbon domain-containing protein, partial [Methanobacteriota archaeon]
TVTLTAATPNKVMNFTLARPPGGVVEGGTIVLIGAIAAAVVIGLLGLMFALGRRRRTRCPNCGKPKAPDQPLCPECQAKGRPPVKTEPPPPMDL